MFATVVWVAPWHYFYFRVPMAEMIRKYILAIAPSQLWFLWMLFMVFMLAFFMSDIMYRNWIVGVLISLVFYAASVIGCHFVPNVYQIWNACSYFGVFYLGMLTRKNLGNVLVKIPNWILISCDIVIFFINNQLSKRVDIISKILNHGLNYMLHIIGAVMAFVVLNALANKLDYNENKIYRFLQKNNFTIYLFHQQVIYWIVDWLNGQVPPLVIVSVSFIAAIVISSLIAVILNKWKLGRIWTGNRE
jgi:hypothetical protein